jgi:hypothetical protein
MVAVYSTPLPVKAGDGWSAAFRMTVQPDPDVDVTVPEDLSAYTDFASQWRASRPSTTAIDLTVDVTDVATGLIVVRATGAQTRAMGASGGFDIEAIGTDGEPRTFVEAKTRWSLDYTRVAS